MLGTACANAAFSLWKQFFFYNGKLKADYADDYFADNQGLSNALGTNNSAGGGVNPIGTTGAPSIDLQAATSAGELINVKTCSPTGRSMTF